MKLYKKLVLAIIVTIFVATPLFALAPQFVPTASAAAPGAGATSTTGYTPPAFGLSQTLQTDLHARQEYLWIRACFQHMDMDKVPYGSEMTGWGWFIGARDDIDGSTSAASAELLIGNSEGAGDAAINHCDTGSNVQTALGLFGFTDATSFFCHIPGAKFNNINSLSDGGGHGPNGTFNQNNSQDMLTCTLNKQHHDWDNDSVSQSTVYAGFQSYVQTTAKGKAASSEPPAMDYLRQYLTFQNACDPSYISAYDGTAANNPTYFKWPIVTPKGDIQYVLVYGDDGGKTVALYGGGSSQYTGDNQTGYGTTSTCGSVAVKARATAAAYAAYVKAHPKDVQSQQPSQSGQSDNGGDQTPSCQSSGGFLAWIMCDILDGVANAVGHAYTDIVQPLLRTPPLDVSGGTSAAPNPQSAGLKTAWSNFRDIANVFLVIALLVIVFGESIGGGLVDAYTAKKVLPRLLIAAILINISYYLVAIAIDISNIIGLALGDLITRSFGMGSIAHANFTSVSDSVSSTVGIVSVSGGVVLVGIATLIPHLFAVIGAGTGAGALAGIASMLEGLLFVILVPALLIIIAVVATLCIRIGLIYLLVVTAPIAFACYCLPNTEPYFRRWWKLMQETLLIYPIIAVMFALSLVLSQSTSWATTANGPVLAGVGYMVSLIMLLLPLIGIPFAFRIAGGILGRIHDFALNAGKQGIQEGLLKSRREAAGLKARTAMGQGRVGMYRKFENGGWASRQLSKRIASYQDMRELEAGMNAETLKRAQATNDTGDDTTFRALTANKKFADAQRANRLGENVDWRDRNGQTEYRTAGGAWVSSGQIDEANRLYGNNNAAKQWALGHEMEKALTQEENDHLANSMGGLLGSGGAWGLSENEATGVLKGAAFSKQNVDRQWKHYGLDYDGSNHGGEAGIHMDSRNALGMFREIDEKQGNYAMMQQNAETWTTMSEAMDSSSRLLADPNAGTAEQRAQAKEILDRGSRIASATRSGSMASSPVEDGDKTTGMRPGGREVGAGAAGRVQEEMIRFTQMADHTAGVYTPPEAASSPIGERAPEGDTYSSLERRGSDRSGPQAPNGTGTGGSAPRDRTF